MTLALQEKRVDGDADKRERQDRSQVIAQMRDLQRARRSFAATFR